MTPALLDEGLFDQPYVPPCLSPAYLFEKVFSQPLAKGCSSKTQLTFCYDIAIFFCARPMSLTQPSAPISRPIRCSGNHSALGNSRGTPFRPQPTQFPGPFLHSLVQTVRKTSRFGDRAADRAVVVPHQASPSKTNPPIFPRRRCTSLRPPPVLVSQEHGHWQKSRASRAGTGLIIRCETPPADHVLV